MSLFHAVGLILTIVAVLGYLNYRLLHLPEPVGITAVGIVASLLVGIASIAYPRIGLWAAHLVGQLDFTELVFEGMLGLLLFAGSLQVSWSDMTTQRWPIAVFATVSVVISASLVGTAFFFVVQWLGFGLPFAWCLVFGALISPTDPIAVRGVLRHLRVAPELENKITGESLFNDGTGVVLFVLLLGIATAETAPTAWDVVALFGKQLVGGGAVGLAVGAVAFFMLRAIDSYPVEILITLAMATAGYALAEVVHGSGPIAVVLMGLVIGNHGREHAMSDRTRAELFSFWALVDDMLNLVLFGLIGLQVVALGPSLAKLYPALVAIPIALAARFVSIALPLAVAPRLMRTAPHISKVMTWAGLRGGISIALALSLPASPAREPIIGATFGVVIFSILVQALTLGPVLRRWKLSSRAR